MGEVVDIGSRGRHISGKLKCLACQHIWIGVAPEGCLDMTCPSCDCNRGVWHGCLWPSEDNKIWKCRSCKCCAFFLVQGGWIMCLGCGDTERCPH